MKCKRCGKSFNPTWSAQKYCGKRCAVRARTEWSRDNEGYVKRYSGKLTDREREQAILLLYLLADVKAQYRNRPINLNLDALRDAWVQYGNQKIHVVGV